MATRFWMPVVLAVACLTLAAPADAVTVSPKEADQAFKQLHSYDYGQDLKPLFVIEAVIDQSSNDPKLRQSVTDRIVAMVQDPKTKLSVKQFLCRQLERLATAKHVPLLAKLFDDPVTQEVARRVLETVPGDEAAALLRGGLAKCKGDTLVGCVNSLGVRRDPKAVNGLARLVAAKDAAVAQAAVRALGKIATPEAAAVLAKVKTKDAPLRDGVARARILCAYGLVDAGATQQADAVLAEMAAANQPLKLQMAGLTGLVKLRKNKALPLVLSALESNDPVLQGTGAKLVAELSGPAAAGALVARLPKLSASAQALVIDLLAQWGGAEARTAMSGLLASKSKPVRLAAIAALGKLGGDATVDVLLKLAMSADEETHQAARDSLARLAGPGVDAKLLAAAAAKGPYETRIELIDAVVARRPANAVPMLVTAATDGHHLVRLAGFKGLRAVAEAKHYPALIRLWIDAPTVADIQAAQKAVLAVARQLPDQDAKVAPLLAASKGVRPEVHVAMVEALSHYGGPKALQAIRASLKDARAKVRDAAARALAGWADPAAAPDLLQIAKTSGDATHKTLALRGYLRLARACAARSAEESLKMLDQVRDAADTPELKRALLAVATDLHTPGALALSASFVGDQDVAAEAALATFTIARAVRKEHPQAAEAALKRVLKLSKDPDAIRRANTLLGNTSFVTLFDGKTLAGWVKPFDWGTVTLVDGAIHLQGEKKFFLVTEKTYGDFVLELEAWLDEGANSGIQYRSHFEKNRLWGYQADVDSLPRGWRGIYDETPGFGWLDRGDAKKAEKLYKKGWNHYRVECIGTRTRFSMNGELIVDHIDPRVLDGHIALQHHGEKGKVVRYRSVRIMDLGKRRWLPLVNEKNLATWQSNGAARWTVEKEDIVGRKDGGGYGLLFSPRPYRDFTVKFQVKAVRGNAGFYIRAEKMPGTQGARGLQLEIDPTKDQSGLYEPHGREWVAKPDQAVVKKHYKRREWNEMAVSAQGRRIVVHLNGRKTVDLPNDPGRLEGFFALGTHGGNVEVRFKDIQILSD
ncbi:DUF1080 domain-containing protein [bacterium]|nr:DUF1080 domain-containing protein [bacterium]